MTIYYKMVKNYFYIFEAILVTFWNTFLSHLLDYCSHANDATLVKTIFYHRNSHAFFLTALSRDLNILHPCLRCVPTFSTWFLKSAFYWLIILNRLSWWRLIPNSIVPSVRHTFWKRRPLRLRDTSSILIRSKRYPSSV